MNRIYFDWNVITNLKRKREAEEPFISIYSFIQKSDTKFLFPFSPAHLFDLKRSFTKSEKAKEYTYKDLTFLNEISKGFCLYADTAQNNRVEPIVCNPHSYFEQIIENDSNFSFEGIFDQTFNDDLKPLFDTFKSIPTGIDINQLNNLPKKYKEFRDGFDNTTKDNTLYNLITDLTAILTDPQKLQRFYKSARNASNEDLKINTNPESWGDPFEFISKSLSKNNINKSFEDLIESNLKENAEGKKFSRFEIFTRYFISLDTFGYFKDGKIPNLIDDAIHAFYGAHCDYFVTDDENTYRKTKAVYKHFGIETVVCKSKDFLNEISAKIKIEDCIKTKTIFEEIIETVGNSKILLNSVDDESNPVTVHEIKYPILDYFNRMQVTIYDEYTTLTFYKKGVNYSNFMFWVEVKTIVDKIVTEYGIDDNSNLLFSEKDKEGYNDNCWIIRSWIGEKTITEIKHLPHPFGLSLIIKISTPKV